MPSSRHCPCARCRFRSALGPIMMITIGILFLAQYCTPYGFGELWPVILIVVGLWKVLGSFIPAEGHVGG
jgi:hypothetical protein